VRQRAAPAGIGNLGYAVGDDMADAVGDGSAGEGVAVERGTAGLVETMGDGFTAVGDEGVHAVRTIATIPATSPNRPLRTWQSLRRSNERPLRR
jgi:hypothetical protein